MQKKVFSYRERNAANQLLFKIILLIILLFNFDFTHYFDFFFCININIEYQVEPAFTSFLKGLFQP